ncbi:MAG: tetratricopeptide repeat protein [Pseudomarimonas sp.]
MFACLLRLLMLFFATTAVVVAGDDASDDLLAIPDDMRVRFENEVMTGSGSSLARLERLMGFVFDADGLGMVYDENATHTVAESWATRRANCLGFSAMFLALAREAGLEAYPQEIRETLAWREQDGTLFRSSHVNVRVKAGHKEFTVDMARDTFIARFRPQRISVQRLQARYFNNLAIAALTQGDIALGQQQIERALALDDSSAAQWSNAGVLHKRAGNRAAAEAAYLRALELDSNHTSALYNIAGLLLDSGDSTRAQHYREQLSLEQKKDPLFHYLLASEYEQTGDLQQAITHYQQAIRWHRSEHRFHSALARALLQAGDLDGASRAISRAQALSGGRIRAAYQTKWEHMQRGHAAG